MRINKIKRNGEGLKLSYTIENRTESGVDSIACEFSSSDRPLPELEEIFKDLIQDVEEICSLPTNYCKFGSVLGVSYSYSSNDTMGAVITASIPLETANSPLIINTPHLPEAPYSEGSETPTLSAVAANRLKRLLICAEKYFEGERYQEPSLFDELKPQMKTSMQELELEFENFKKVD